MSQRRLLPILVANSCAIPVIINKNQIRGHQRSVLISAKSADVVKIENVTAQNDIHSQKTGQGLSPDSGTKNAHWRHQVTAVMTGHTGNPIQKLSTTNKKLNLVLLTLVL